MTGVKLCVIEERSETLVDQMDLALDNLRTVWLVLASEDQGFVDAAHMHTLATVLDNAIHDLRPVRKVLDGIDCG